MKKSRRRVPAVIIVLLVSTTLSAAGRHEDPIRQARELVGANRINEAILLLEQTIREDPDRIVEAESLMRTIRGIRGEYNVLFELLIDNLVNNPDDITRTLEIIDRMEALDQFPNERVLAQVEDARIIAQLAYDRNIVNETMDRAFRHLQNDDYLAATEAYLSLRGLQRERFEARGYGDIFLDRAEATIGRLDRVTEGFLAALEPYRNAGDAVLTTAGQDLRSLDREQFEMLVSEARSLAGVMEQAETLAQDLTVLRSQVPLQFPNNPVDWYLTFHEYITRGRPGQRDQEGIAFAVRRFYEDAPRVLADIAGTVALTSFQDGLEVIREDRATNAERRFSDSRDAAVTWERAEGLLLEIFELNPNVTVVEEQVSPERSKPFLEARIVREGAESLRRLSTQLNDLIAVESEETTSANELIDRKTTVRAVVEGSGVIRDDWETQVELLQRLAPAYLPEPMRDRLTEISSRHTAIRERAVARERDLAIQISQLRSLPVTTTITQADADLSGIQPLLDGVEEPLDDSDDEDAFRIVRYPDDALDQLEQVNTRLLVATNLLETVQAELLSDAEHVRSGPSVQLELARLATLTQQLQQLTSRTAQATTQGETLIAEALELQGDGNQRIADARAAIAALQIDAARNNWDDARDAFFESLELREDPAFRVAADNLISQVGNELLELENVIVVQRVREFLNQAEALYNQDEYVAARDILLDAQQTWEQTNVESNSEIDRWLLLATAALNLEEGRELSPADPLYPVLGNYLSLAREDFNRGMRLFDQGREAEANRLFDRSIENLRNVRDVRPLNWDARILELRIVQVRNADEFDEIFATRYNQAVGRLDEDGPLQVFSELEALAEINPNFPGLQAQLRRLEITLNLRPDPVDQRRVVEAQRLYQQAQNLSSGSRDQVVVAVSLLEDAVDLNPGNSNARFLLDQLRIRLGGQATAALSTTDEQQYRRAETLFQQGQVLQALAIAERLLSNPANQGYPPLVELRRRIGLRLGI